MLASMSRIQGRSKTSMTLRMRAGRSHLPLCSWSLRNGARCMASSLMTRFLPRLRGYRVGAQCGDVDVAFVASSSVLSTSGLLGTLGLVWARGSPQPSDQRRQQLRKTRQKTQVDRWEWSVHPRPRLTLCTHVECLPPWPVRSRGPLPVYVLIHPAGECAKSSLHRANAGFLQNFGRTTAGFRLIN